MDQSVFIELTNNALITTAIICVPILIPGLIAGVIISIFQAVTQINEQTLTFVPKLIILIISYLITGPWITAHLMHYTTEMIERVTSI